MPRPRPARRERPGPLCRLLNRLRGLRAAGPPAGDGRDGWVRFERAVLLVLVEEPAVDRLMPKLGRLFAPRPGDGPVVLCDDRGGPARFARGCDAAAVSVGSPLVADFAPRRRTLSQLAADGVRCGDFADRDPRRAVWRVGLPGTAPPNVLVCPEPAPLADDARLPGLLATAAGVLGRRLAEERDWRELRREASLRNGQLALREAAEPDGEPTAVTRRLLEILREHTGADRAGLWLTGGSRSPVGGNGGPGDPVFRTSVPNGTGPVAVSAAGEAKPRHAADAWRRHEATLVRWAGEQVEELSTRRLRERGVDTLLGRAVVGPPPRVMPTARLVLTRSDPAPFPPSATALTAWAADYFAEAIPRVLGRSAVARRARRDGLTGLANRHAFDGQLDALLRSAAASGGNLALLLCDVDRFKAVNDTHGHPAGDAVLRGLAAVLTDVVGRTRADDSALCARYGGEELAVLLPDFGPGGGLRVAEAIRRETARRPFPTGAGELSVTLSIGVAVSPLHATDPAGLVAAADAALYRAKHGGRNRVEVAGAPEVTTPAARAAGAGVVP